MSFIEENECQNFIEAAQLRLLLSKCPEVMALSDDDARNPAALAQKIFAWLVERDQLSTGARNSLIEALLQSKKYAEALLRLQEFKQDEKYVVKSRFIERALELSGDDPEYAPKFWKVTRQPLLVIQALTRHRSCLTLRARLPLLGTT